MRRAVLASPAAPSARSASRSRAGVDFGRAGRSPARTRSAPVLAPKRDVVEHVMESYHFFTFGTPSVTQLSDGTIVMAFYVTEESVTYVRCCRVVERD